MNSLHHRIVTIAAITMNTSSLTATIDQERYLMEYLHVPYNTATILAVDAAWGMLIRRGQTGEPTRIRVPYI